MRNKALETWAWVLLYGGLLLAALGWFVAAAMAAAGTVMMTAGAALAVAGAAMIWWRSTRKD